MTVLAATAWRDNATMIAEAVVPLGYIKPDDRVIDLTFGRGKWWTKYRHQGMIGLTGDPTLEVEGVTLFSGVDYTNPEALHRQGWLENGFDVVALDPPYISVGGRETSTLPDFNDRYGLSTAARTPRALHIENAEVLRTVASGMLRPGGLALVKCAPYISSGKMQEADLWMRESALTFGMSVVDRLLHVGHARAQPLGRGPQQHARNNYSVLWVFQTTKKGRASVS